MKSAHEIAHETIRHVWDALPYGSATRPDSTVYAERVTMMRDTAALFLFLYNAVNINVNHYKVFIDIAKWYKCGNCIEQSLVGYQYIKSMHPNVDVSVMFIQNGDHVFLKIGSSEDTFLCDIWARKVYRWSDLKGNLYDHVYEDNEHKLIKFNPATQEIIPIDVESQMYIGRIIPISKTLKVVRVGLIILGFLALDAGLKSLNIGFTIGKR
jgi:hypothetical protein